MDDRVGDLLAERSRLGGGAGPGIAVSLLLHGSIAAAVVYAAMHATAPQEMSTLTIQFANPAVASAPAPIAPTPPPALPPKKLPIPEPVAEPPKPVVKSEPKTVPLSAFGKSSRKGSETPPAPHPQPPTPQIAAKPGVVGGTDIPVGGAGVTGIEGDFPYTIYIDRMRVLISQRFLRPQSGNNLTTTISFSINRDGSIRDEKTEIASGDGTFDRAALRAVLEASPLPPLPFGYNGTYLGVHLTFR
ncbi:MAG TPA: TonB family protein [Thermoanaerobaculia bacterium]|jgi:TonB family protein|nr:TonB family protein [Thermoanaerobaculia bacterium]